MVLCYFEWKLPCTLFIDSYSLVNCFISVICIFPFLYTILQMSTWDCKPDNTMFTKTFLYGNG